eukprot:COSAG06_NODE_1254_length_10093_cov_2.384231_7_plen_120_part_00
MTTTTRARTRARTSREVRGAAFVPRHLHAVASRMNSRTVVQCIVLDWHHRRPAGAQQEDESAFTEAGRDSPRSCPPHELPLLMIRPLDLSLCCRLKRRVLGRRVLGRVDASALDDESEL